MFSAAARCLITRMSSSESEVEFTTPSKNLKRDIDQCITMKPDKAPSTSKLRRKLKNCKNPKPSTLTLRSSKQDRSEIEESLSDLVRDSGEFHKKMQLLQDCMVSILDKFDALEARILSLERASTQTSGTDGSSYAAVAAAASSNESRATLDRVVKLEYQSSEEERKRRLLQVSLTHPEIDTSATDLQTNVRSFLSTRMKMEAREIDSAFRVQKSTRENSVLIFLSHQRFKNFIYSTRKRLREANDSIVQNLYINDNLTPYNLALLRDLKSEKSCRSSEGLSSFHAVYTFHGKVFVKRTVGQTAGDAVWIKTPEASQEFLRSLSTATTFS